MHRHRGNVYGTQLQIGNTDLLLMQWIQDHFGGSLNLEQRSNAKHQPVWRWLASMSDLDLILSSLIPYLKTKKRQAELFVAYRRTVNRERHVTARKSASVESERKQIHTELSALKRPHLRAVSA